MSTPLAKATGLGSAKDGTNHFWRQRLTAVANVPLIIFFVILVISLQGENYETIKDTLANPFISIFMLLIVLSGVYHMKLGMQVIIEDYVHGEFIKVMALIGNIFFCTVVGLASIYAILKISFGI